MKNKDEQKPLTATFLIVGSEDIDAGEKKTLYKRIVKAIDNKQSPEEIYQDYLKYCKEYERGNRDE